MNCVKNLSKRGVALLMALLLCINVLLFSPAQKAKAVAVVDDVVYCVLATVLLAALGYEFSNVMDVAAEEFWKVGKPLADTMMKADAAGKVWMVGLADCWLEGWKVLKDGISVPSSVLSEAQQWANVYMQSGSFSPDIAGFDTTSFFGEDITGDPLYTVAVNQCRYYISRYETAYAKGDKDRVYWVHAELYCFTGGENLAYNGNKISFTLTAAPVVRMINESVMSAPDTKLSGGVMFSPPITTDFTYKVYGDSYTDVDVNLVTNCPGLSTVPDITYIPASVKPDENALPDLPLEEDGSLTVSIPQDLPVDDSTSLPVTDSLAQGDVIAGTVDPPVDPPDPPVPPAVDGLDGFKLPELITTKFPFCIPFDVLRTVQMLSAPAETPVFEIPFKAEFIGVDETITIDFSQFDTLAAIMRWMLSALFLLGLIMATRNLIKG